MVDARNDSVGPAASVVDGATLPVIVVVAVVVVVGATVAASAGYWAARLAPSLPSGYTATTQ